jgi:hypothetical protein
MVSTTRLGLGLLVLGLLMIPLPGPGILVLIIGSLTLAAGLIMDAVGNRNSAR